jgi:hypothetical protein
MNVIVTVSAYALGKRLGLQAAMQSLATQVTGPNGVDTLPAIRVVKRLRELADLALRLDTGGTVLGKVRSRHAHAAWESGAEVWVSCDDDVEATMPTLAMMLDAVNVEWAAIVIVPCMVRSESKLVSVVNIELPRIVTSERILESGARLRPVPRGGWGLVAMNRAALEAVRAASQHLAYLDVDGV